MSMQRDIDPDDGSRQTLAWMDVADLPSNPAVRDEVQSTPWDKLAAQDATKAFVKSLMTAGEMHKAGNAQTLRDWYESGADGQISWGDSGDFEACVAIAGKFMDNPEGYCQERHMAATGAPAGHASGEKSVAEEAAELIKQALLPELTKLRETYGILEDARK